MSLLYKVHLCSTRNFYLPRFLDSVLQQNLCCKSVMMNVFVNSGAPLMNQLLYEKTKERIEIFELLFEYMNTNSLLNLMCSQRKY